MNETIIKTALIYCRVSTEEQAREGYSLDTQEKFCRNFAKANGYRILHVYRDEGKSGTTLDRPALQDVLAECQQKATIGAVLVQEIDRWGRDTKNHLITKAILQKSGTRLISVAQPMVDESPEGNMIDTILASVAQFQSDINSRKTKKGLQEKFDSGWWPGWAPLGYLNKNANDKGIVVKDPERWNLVKEALKMYITGNYSALEIADTMYEKGLVGKKGKRLGNGIMISILRNPFYAGIMKWNKQEKFGNHEPLITPDEHSQILSIMSAHNQHACRRRKYSFLLRGFAFCGICGGRYTADKHRIGKNPDYYHCGTNRGKHSNKWQNIETEELEKQVGEKFRDIQFSQNFIDLVVSKVKKFYEAKKTEKERSKRILFNKKTTIEKKREVAEEKLIAGTLKDGDFVRIRERLREEISVLQNQIDEIENLHKVDTDTIRQVLTLSRNIYKAYKQAPYEIKRLYLGFFWEKFVVKNQKIISSEPTKLIKTLKNEGKIQIRHNWLRG